MISFTASCAIRPRRGRASPSARHGSRPGTRGPALTLIEEVDAKPHIDLSDTKDTALTLAYGMEVSAVFLPTNELSWTITRRFVIPTNRVPAPIAVVDREHELALQQVGRDLVELILLVEDRLRPLPRFSHDRSPSLDR